MNLNHMHLTATDVPKQVSFYEDYFGLRRCGEAPGIVFLQDEIGFLLALSPSESPPDFPSWFHLGFCLGNPGLVRDLFARMQRDGVRFARELTGEEGRWLNFFCLDPAGYKVEVSWEQK